MSFSYSNNNGSVPQQIPAKDSLSKLSLQNYERALEISKKYISSLDNQLEFEVQLRIDIIETMTDYYRTYGFQPNNTETLRMIDYLIIQCIKRNLHFLDINV